MHQGRYTGFLLLTYHEVMKFIRPLAQTLGLILFWMLINQLVLALHLPLPASVMGLLILLALLLTGVLPVSWVKAGATCLLAELMLFFMPSMVSVLQYRTLFASYGLAILGVILPGTIIVMVGTAAVTELAFRLERRLRTVHKSTMGAAA